MPARWRPDSRSLPRQERQPTGPQSENVRSLSRSAGIRSGCTLLWTHGGATRFIGSALNLKPILALRDGRVEAEDRVRTKSKALDRVLSLVGAQVSGKQNIRLATVHANAEPEARELLDRAGKELGAVESLLAAVSPVVGAHAGPGTVGLCYMAGI